MAPRRTPSTARRPLAWRLEAALQAALSASRDAWSAVRHGRDEWGASDFSGGACHCPPGLPEHFLHSEAIREACDFVVDFGTNVRNAGRPLVPPERLPTAMNGLQRGATVHVKTDLLDAFVARLLPRVREPIVLVTGDSDLAAVAKHRALLDHPRIAHWFAQNCDLPGRHSRLTRLPIGLDNPVYTKLEKRLGFALTMALGRTPFDPTISANDIGDQAELQHTRAALPAPAARPIRVLCTFHQNQKLVAADISGLPDRAQAVRDLRANACCHFVSRRLRQRDCWRLHGEFAFEASPHGNGLDCFRTWEALLLGTIPIVRRSTLEPLFVDEALPVAIVDAWTEITPANLTRWREELQPRLGSAVDAKLRAAYWVAKIKKASQSVAHV